MMNLWLQFRNMFVFIAVLFLLQGKMTGQMIGNVKGDFSIVLKADGNVYTWGNNQYGQLGNGNYQNSNIPVAVNRTGVLAGKTIIQVAGGLDHSIALASDGSVYTWGKNWYGQLGNGSSTSTNLPIAVSTSGFLNGKTIIQVDAGLNHSIALASDGSVYTWGLNSYGQLGEGTNINYNTPVPVNSMGVLAGKNIIKISAGSNYCLALSSDGAVFSWGENSSGELGDGSNSDTNVPVAVNKSGALFNKIIKKISAGSGHCIVLDADGEAYCWGLNSDGQLGSGTDISSNLPLKLSETGTIPGKTIKEIYAGGTHSIALTNDNLIYTWGGNYYGQLGNSSNTASYTPILVDSTGVLNGKTFIQVATGYLHSLALSIDGSVYSWGYNYYGQLGDGTFIDKNTPIMLSKSSALAGKNIIQVSAGALFTVVLADDNQAYCWGRNDYGQLGVGNHSNSSIPIAVTNTGVLSGKTGSRIAAGGYHTLIVTTDGKVFAWGLNGNGQLGNNDEYNANSNMPVAVNLNGALSGKKIITASAGNYHSLVMDTSGVLYAWGSNYYGQLGIGNYTSSKLPVKVNENGALAGKRITQIASGGYHNIVLASDGTVFTWGDNSYGQLGNGTTVKSNLPISVTSTGVLAGKTIIWVAAGGNHSVVATSEGKVYAWGDNFKGQLGNGNNANSSLPVEVSFTGVLSNKVIIQVDAGEDFSVALTNNGESYSWGNNFDGELGNGTNTSSNLPVTVNRTGRLNNKTIIKFSAGGYHCIALDSEGNAYTWGLNEYGQLGNKSTNSSYVPVSIDNESMVPLPVELTSFSAEYKNGETHLNWQTATEVNNHGFEIERKQENTNWQTIGFVKGAGNSNRELNYSYRDKITGNKMVFYRLKQVDTDGSFSYSKEVEVNPIAVTAFKLEQNYPNPFNPVTKINYSVPVKDFVTLKVYNTLGKEVTTLKNEIHEAGEYSVDFAPVNLPSGVYVYVLQGGKNRITKKMLYLK